MCAESRVCAEECTSVCREQSVCRGVHQCVQRAECVQRSASVCAESRVSAEHSHVSSVLACMSSVGVCPGLYSVRRFGGTFSIGCDLFMCVGSDQLISEIASSPRLGAGGA